MNMKNLLLPTSVIAFLATTGCLVSDGGHYGHSRGHGRYQRHEEVIVVGPPPIVVRPPVVVVRPPMVIVR